MQVISRRPSTLRFKSNPVFRCIECGHPTDILPERKFKCRECSGLLEVDNGLNFSAGQVTRLKNEFRRRAHMYAAPGLSPLFRSGVWRFHELIMPLLKPEQIVSLGEGIVPIVPAGRNLRKWIGGDIEILIILEGSGPTGSFKDFGGTVAISVAKAAGVKAVGCASTGDTSAMAGAYAGAAGMTSFVLLPEGKVTDVQLMQPAAHGSRVITIPGSFDDCMEMMERLIEMGAYPINSLNPTRIEGHQATVFLVAQFLRWRLPEWFVVPVGNGSNSSSIGKGIRLLLKNGFVGTPSRILGCQTAAANPLAHSWAETRDAESEAGQTHRWRNAYKVRKEEPVGETTATAARIGKPVSAEKVIRAITETDGVMQTASEADLNEGMFVCASDGLLVCPQTGIALAGLRSAVRDGYVKNGETAVVVSTATGMKFADVYTQRVRHSIERSPDKDPRSVAKMLGL